MVAQSLPDVLTPEQVAAYLQVDERTVRDLIRDERLIASQIGDDYRIQKRHVDLLLWTTQNTSDVRVRDYSDDELAAFFNEDELDAEARAAAQSFARMMDAQDEQ